MEEIKMDEVKRGRGRPRGSKKEKVLDEEVVKETDAPEEVSEEDPEKLDIY